MERFTKNKILCSEKHANKFFTYEKFMTNHFVAIQR